MEKKMKILECPFTWQINEELMSEFNESQELIIDFDEEPLFFCIDTMITAYLQAKNNCNEQAIQKMKVLDDYYWEKPDQGLWDRYGVSKSVLFHVKEATKYYICKLTSCESEANEILKNIEDGKNFCSATELATISGCKSVVWSKFHEKTHRQVTESARLAIAGSPDCPLWHYILARALKHARGEDYFIAKPSAEEEESIIRSSQLSDSPFYKIHLAQMYYREHKELPKAKIMYTEIHNTNPQGQGILLRLAAAFTTLRDFENASLCFEKVEKYPTNTMYHYYKGVFLIKTKQFEKAAFHLQKATGYGSSKANILYAWTMHKIDNNFDFIAHLKAMLEKYTKLPIKHVQNTLLHIAMHFYYKKNDLKNTLTYLLKAIECDPQNRQLERYTNTTINWERLNIYVFTHERLQQISNGKELIKEMKHTVKKLRDHCLEYRNRDLVQFSNTQQLIE